MTHEDLKNYRAPRETPDDLIALALFAAAIALLLFWPVAQ